MQKVARITRSCQKVAEQLLESPRRGRVQPLKQRNLRQNKIFSSFYANLDYETKSEYSIAVRSSDNGSPRLSIDKTFTIQVSGSALVMICQRIG